MIYVIVFREKIRSQIHEKFIAFWFIIHIVWKISMNKCVIYPWWPWPLTFKERVSSCWCLPPPPRNLSVPGPVLAVQSPPYMFNVFVGGHSDPSVCLSIRTCWACMVGFGVQGAVPSTFRIRWHTASGEDKGAIGATPTVRAGGDAVPVRLP